MFKDLIYGIFNDSDASLKQVDFAVPYHNSTYFTLGIPISWICDDQKHTNNVDLVLILYENSMYNVAIVYIDTDEMIYSENTTAIIWYI